MRYHFYSHFGYNYLVLFHLWWMEIVLKCEKVYKYYFQLIFYFKKGFYYAVKSSDAAKSLPVLINFSRSPNFPNFSPGITFRLFWNNLWFENYFIPWKKRILLTYWTIYATERFPKNIVESENIELNITVRISTIPLQWGRRLKRDCENSTRFKVLQCQRQKY